MSTPLRIASFNNLPFAFELVRGWAAEYGHEIVIVVTTPGPKSRRSEGYKQIAAVAGEHNIETLVSTRMKTVVTPVLRALKPDLIVSASFPWLLPPELLATAKIGAINTHPALLPAYRGPNAMRQFYEQTPRMGATAHWIAPDFDTGNILAQFGADLPNPCLPETVLPDWRATMVMALQEGVTRAVAADPGRVQPTDGVSYGTAFTEQERWLDLHEKAYALQCKCTALVMAGLGAKVRIGEDAWSVSRVTMLPEADGHSAVGSILRIVADGLVVQTGDGVVQLTAGKDG